MPAGSPSLMPHGTDIAGWPVTSKGRGVRQHLERALANFGQRGIGPGHWSP